MKASSETQRFSGQENTPREVGLIREIVQRLQADGGK